MLFVIISKKIMDLEKNLSIGLEAYDKTKNLALSIVKIQQNSASLKEKSDRLILFLCIHSDLF